MDDNVTVNIVRNLNKHTVIGLVSIVLIIATAFVLSLAIYFIWADKDAREGVGIIVRGFHLQNDGTEIPVPTRKQFGFWTPSSNTSLPTESSKYRWEKINSKDNRPDKFEDYVNSISLGWRRYNQTGRGTSRKKNGYWWILSVDPGFNYKAFIEKYHDIWCQNKIMVFPECKRFNVYIEEYPNQSKYIEKSSNK